jgi:hypothetical protein
MLELIDDFLLDRAAMDGTVADRFLGSRSGLVLHEIGHLVASANCGVPADFLVLAWQKGGPGYHGVWYDRSVAHLLAPHNEACLIAGYAAERIVFRRATIHRAKSDLEALAPLFGIPDFDLTKHGDALSELVINKSNPFSEDDRSFIVHIYNIFAHSINMYRMYDPEDGGVVIPNYDFPKLGSRIPLSLALRANFRSRSNRRREQAYQEFRRSGGRSGA